MNREQITIELESATARLRGLQEELLIAEIELLAAHRRVLDAQDILSAIGGAR